MIFPYSISKSEVCPFQFQNPFIREVVWRRHQCEQNKFESNWQSPSDCRRRIVHVRDVYGFDSTGLYLKDSYLWVHLSLPETEIKEYEDWLRPKLDIYWSNQGDHWRQGTISCFLKTSPNCLNISLQTYTSPILEEKAWSVFNLGLRKKRQRGNPREIAVSELLKYAPFNLELGSGPSLEVGVPPLHHFHKIYSIVNSDGSFVFNLKDDNLLKRMVSDVNGLYFDITQFFKRCVEVDINNAIFYQSLKQMKEKGVLFDPIFTNNFDGLTKRVGVAEYPLFGFDTVYPTLEFTAKSLLVIGSHADRRLVREQARKAGMQIIFVDPEFYDGKSYLLEDAQDNDLLIRLKSSEFANELNQILA